MEEEKRKSFEKALPQLPLPSSNGGDFELRHYKVGGASRQSSLRRRIAAPAMLDVRPAAPADHEQHHCGSLTSEQAGYMSIRDILASSPTAASGFPSPTGAAVSSAHDIQIKNHLVKHAAFAYLQPTPSIIESRRRRGRFRQAIARLSVESCIGLVGRALFAICKGRER